MTKDEALRALGERKTELLSRIPESAPAKGKRFLGYIIDEELAAARHHLEALYAHGQAVGPDFAALPDFAGDSKYSFWLEGIRRHFQRCEASLGEHRPAT